MTLNNSFRQTKRKSFKYWQESVRNTVRIRLQLDRQDLINGQLSRTDQTNNLQSVQLLELDYVPLIIAEQSPNFNLLGVAYQNWEVVVSGLKFNELQCIRHSYLFKFGNGEPLLDFNIQQLTVLYTNNYIECSSKEDFRGNIFTLHYGVYLQDVDGLEEISENGLMANLNLSFTNPNYYR